MVTLADIAKEVGVAPQVVSRVLHGGKGTASARLEVRERIKEVAARHGYRPFAAGQILRNRSFRSVGILIGNENDFLLSQDSLAGLIAGLSRSDYTGTLYYAEGDSNEELSTNRLLASQLTDALVIPYVRSPRSRFFREVMALKVPVIWLNRRARFDAVAMDEAGAAAQLVTHLAEEGHRRITFVEYSGGGRDPHTRERVRGGQAAAKKYGVTLDVIAKQVPRSERAAAARALLRSRGPRALIVNSLSAAQVILQVAKELHLEVPNDLALASFDDGHQYSANVPFITCAIRPGFAFGQAAADLVLKRLQPPGEPQRALRVPFDLRIGGTTRT